MKKNLLLLFVLIFSATKVFSQDYNNIKLVVGVVVDQMRYVDLYRYQQFYSDNGFNRLMNEGTNFSFAHFNYELTSTGPGHASIYTGSTPFYHGIIGNDYFDRTSNKTIYCVKDENQKSVGSDDEVGKCSPKNLLSTTITDELKLFTNKKSKVFSISIKDRGSILPGGHLADAAYWYNYNNGNFISSTYYLKNLPEWVNKFNQKKLVDNYLSNPWQLFLDEKVYTLNPSDESKYEGDIFKEGKTSFPHFFDKLSVNEKYNKFQFTPFGNQILVDFAKELIVNENLGKNTVPDFMAISFSSTDIIGHEFGNYSYELMDTYLRLDKQIAELIDFLDQKIGRENYVLFLTSDHAAIPTQGYLKENNIPTGEINMSRLQDSLKLFCEKNYGSKDIISDISNRQIYLNRNFINKNQLSQKIIEDEIESYLRTNFFEIQSIFTRDFLETKIASRQPDNTILNGWNPSLSGDIAFNLRPGFLNNYLKKGATHSSSYNYDTHCPMLFFGGKIPAQKINSPVYIVDISATIANLLNINEPSACTGIPIIQLQQK